MGLSLLWLSMRPKLWSGVPTNISLVSAKQAAVSPNIQPASSFSHPSEVSSRAQAHLDFSGTPDHHLGRTVGKGLYIQSLEAPDGRHTQDHHMTNSEENGAFETLNMVKHLIPVAI